MQEQIKESLSESRQTRQLQQELFIRLTSLETKIEAIPLTQSYNPLVLLHHQDQHFL